MPNGNIVASSIASTAGVLCKRVNFKLETLLVSQHSPSSVSDPCCPAWSAPVANDPPPSALHTSWTRRGYWRRWRRLSAPATPTAATHTTQQRREVLTQLCKTRIYWNTHRPEHARRFAYGPKAAEHRYQQYNAAQYHDADGILLRHGTPAKAAKHDDQYTKYLKCSIWHIESVNYRMADFSIVNHYSKVGVWLHALPFLLRGKQIIVSIILSIAWDSNLDSHYSILSTKDLKELDSEGSSHTYSVNTFIHCQCMI